MALTASCLAQQTWAEFPEDDPKLTVVDRAYKSFWANDKEVHYYAVLSNDSTQSYFDVYKGLPWKRVHRWPVSFEGEKVKVTRRAAVQIADYDDRNVIHFYWNDYAGYSEGAVHLGLSCDRATGKFKTHWSD